MLNSIFDLMDDEFQDRYVVMNKYDEVPYKLPSDLDMSVTPRDFARLDTLMTHVSQRSGLLLVQKIWHGYQKCAYVFTPAAPTGRFRLQLDFFTDFSVKHTPRLIAWQEIQRSTRRYGRFTVPDYPVEYTFLLMRRVFKDDFDKEHVEAVRLPFAQDEARCRDRVARVFSASLCERLNALVAAGDDEALRSLRPELWQELRRYSKRQSSVAFSVKFRLYELRRFCFRVRYPVGMCVALLSPDGGGKSTVFERMAETCWGSFYGIEKMYFRPHLFRNPGMLNPLHPVPEAADNPDPHGRKPNGLLKSLVRYFYYNLDYVLGYNVLVRKKCVQKKLVVFDRYYYDYFVDLQRYQYSFPKFVPRLFAWMIPTPDIIFVLEGTPEVLYARKEELPVEEIARQVKAYHSVAARYRNAVTIDVDKPVESVVAQVTSTVIMRKAQRTARAMGNTLDKDGIPVC